MTATHNRLLIIINKNSLASKEDQNKNEIAQGQSIT